MIQRNMAEGRIGMRTGAGFLIIPASISMLTGEKWLAELVDLLRHFGLARSPVR